MDLKDRRLRDRLDPTALRILKKRLISGKITPQVFKDILKRQMVKYFFQTYRHPLAQSWDHWRETMNQRLREQGNPSAPHREKTFAVSPNKQF